MSMQSVCRAKLICLLVLACGHAVALGGEPPPVSEDGLVLEQGKVARILYVRPGVDFSRYQRIAILDCPVAFSKDWARERSSTASRISARDMEEIKAGLSKLFREVFTEELERDGGYTIVTASGEDVLGLRPAIVDLDITAPDTMTAGRSYTLTDSAGAMTLYLELFDGPTGQILARAIDRRSDQGSGRFQWQTGVSNRAEASRILRRWARALRERLDEVTGRSGS